MMDTSLTLSFNEVVGDLLEIIEEKGSDYRYEKPGGSTHCQYFRGLQPGCIVGHLLAKHGVTYETLGSTNNSKAVSELVDCYVLNIDDKTRAFLVDVQSSQDNGNSWGRAMDLAIGQL
jgi:hypothetical protein